MQITAETPRVTRTIAELALSVAAPYAAGHVVTEAEAAMLNQTVAENIGNNLRQKIKDGQLDADGNPTGVPFTAEEAQAMVDAYTAEYEPGVRTSGGGSARIVDPVEKEARNMAKSKVLEHVKAKGLKAKDVNVVELTDAVMAKHGDVLRAEAAKIVKARTKAAKNSGDLLSDLTIG